MSEFSDKLRSRLAKKTGKTVTEMALDLKIGRPALSNVLNGKSDLSMELAIKIQMEYGLDASKLLYAQLDEQMEKTRKEIFAVDEDDE